MKKVIGLILTAVISVTMFAACANTPAEVTEHTSEVSDKTTEQLNGNSAKVTINGNKFMVNGKELWINGVNTPWQKWNDFNGNMDEEAWDATFAELKTEGVNCTRIWVNCDGIGTVNVADSGEITEINAKHWDDLDKLFAIADKYKIYIMPTLLSFDHFKESNAGYLGWRAMVTNKEYSDAYAEKYVAEFAKRYGNNEYLFAIDLMNEPDWVYENEECGQISWDDLSYFFAKSIATIHENSSALVTVGFAMNKYNSIKFEGDMLADDYLIGLTGDEKSAVDFYSTHYYIWEKQWFGYPFDIEPRQFGLITDKPCIIAETSNDDDAESGMSAKDKYISAYNNGWQGVMVWMEYRTDGTSGCDSLWYRYDLTKEATNAMLELIPDKIYPLGNQ